MAKYNADKIRKRREQKRLSMKKARQKLREDPKKYEEAKRIDRERYKKRKDSGKIKPISECLERTKRQIRKEWKKRSQIYRDKKKKQTNLEQILIDMSPPPSPKSFIGENQNSVPSTSRVDSGKKMDISSSPERATSSQSLEFVEDSTATTSAQQLRENPEKTSVSTKKINTPDTFMLSDTSSCSEVEPRIKRRISSSSTEQTVNNFQTIANDYTSDDEFDLFCKSLACQLKKMPLDRALICQEKLQSVMTEERLYQIGASRCEQQSEAARYEIVVKEEEDLGTEEPEEIVVKEEDLGTEEPEEYKILVKEEIDIDIDDEFL